MEIKQITDQNYAEKWDNFVISNSKPSAFLQSWQWGEFKNSTQNPDNNKQENLLRFLIKENNEIIAVAQFSKIALPGGKFYLNCAHGPIISTQNSDNKTQEVFNLIINEIKKIAKKEKIIFFRINPNLKKETKLKNFIKPKVLRNLKEPENSLILNLENSEEILLKEMHPKTRYNIRLAEKKGIKIKEEKNIDNFYSLSQETAERDKINIFPKKYYEKLLLTPNSLLLTAYYENQPLSSIILYNFGNTTTYLYGASSNEKRNLMPNYLIQWHAIQYAKSQNYKYYDFWGYDKNKTKWSGINKFKAGFVSEKSGQEINRIDTLDYILNKTWYNLFRVAIRLRSIFDL